MSDHVESVCRSCYFQLRQLRQIKGSLTSDAIKTLVHAFISSRLDYCNSLLVNLSDDVPRKLQLILNAAARLVSGTRKFDRITPVLRDLHWLPVRERITFRTVITVYKCLHGLAPPYLSVFCRPFSTVPGRRQLRSADSGMLVVPRTKTRLPADLRLCELTVATFAKRLKSYLFNLLLPAAQL